MNHILYIGDKQAFSGVDPEIFEEEKIKFDFLSRTFDKSGEHRKLSEKISETSYDAVAVEFLNKSDEEWILALRKDGINTLFICIDTGAPHVYDLYGDLYMCGFDAVIPHDKKEENSVLKLFNIISGLLERRKSCLYSWKGGSSELRYRHLFNAAHDAIVITGTDNRIIDANPSAIRLFEYPECDLMKMTICDLMTPEEREKCEVRKRSGIEDKVYAIEMEFENKKGSKIDCEVNLTPVCEDGMQVLMGTIRDISERKAGEEALRLSLKEKTFLLQEVHHRVKNNLQLIISMINLQILAEENKRTVLELREIENRIQAISLVHENLYCSLALDSVDAGQHFSALCQNVLENVSPTDDILLRCEIADLKVPVKTAVPLSLAVNELIMNSIKYAFEEGDKKEISVIMEEKGDCVRFMLSDNGKGMPEKFSFENNGSFGLSIVKGLVCTQLDGSINLCGGEGTNWEFLIPENKFFRY